MWNNLILSNLVRVVIAFPLVMSKCGLRVVYHHVHVRDGTINEESRLTISLSGELCHYDGGLHSRGIVVHNSCFWGIVLPLMSLMTSWDEREGS